LLGHLIGRAESSCGRSDAAKIPLSAAVNDVVSAAWGVAALLQQIRRGGHYRPLATVQGSK
jgi:hypothetical protein